MLELLDGLEARLFRAVAVVPGSGPLHDALRLRQIPTYVVDVRWWLPQHGAQSYFRYYCEDIPDLINPILNIIHEHQIDIVYSCNSLILHGALAALVARRPHVHHLQELLGRSGGTATLPLGSPWLAYRIIGTLSSTVVPSGGASRRDVGRAIADAKCRLIPTGVAVDPSASSRSVDLPDGGNERIRVGIVGLVHPQKGSDIIAKVVKRACTTVPQLRFYWAGPDPQHLMDSIVKQACVDDTQQLHFLGYVNDVPAFMNSIDFLIHLSTNDTFPRVVLEAAAMGRPVVATRCGGPEEMIEDGVSGFLVPVNDVEALSDAIVRLASNTELRRQMSAAARRAASRFDLGTFQSAMQQTLLEAYRDGPAIRSRLGATLVSCLVRAPARLSRLVARTRALRILRGSSRWLRRHTGALGQGE